MKGLFRAAALLLIWLAGSLGCSTAEPVLGRWSGPAEAYPVEVSPWSYGHRSGYELRTKHYVVFTTLRDEQTARMLPQVMEGALERYRELAPGVPDSDRPMECYLFQLREDFERYTVATTGSDAAVYLRIRNGGYAIRDRYVGHYVGLVGTMSLASHEGWHQYTGRHFRGRLPPMLEEGISCMFESVKWEGGLPRWNLSVNSYRAQSLRTAMDKGHLWSLEELIEMHAGDAVTRNVEKVEAFYAQSWCFARFLWEGEGGKYRQSLQRLLTETALGTVEDPSRSHQNRAYPWNRTAARPLLERYLRTDFQTLAREFGQYMRTVAYDEYMMHFRS